MATDKERVSLYLEKSTKEKMTELARVERRSLSNMIEILCEKEIRRARGEGRLDNDHGRIRDLGGLGNTLAGNLGGEPTNELLPPTGTLGGR